MRIVWNAYIREQLHWADRLSQLALETDATRAGCLKVYARRAVANALAATKSQISSDNHVDERP